MPVERVATSNHVIMRDNFGRFVKAIEDAGGATVDDMLEAGAAQSRALAPRGHKKEARDVSIADSIFIRRLSRTAGVWGSTSGHALPQEKGSKPHIIAGNPGLKFYWEREGRMFLPAAGGKVTIVHHPGNPARPFLRPAYEMVMANWSRYAKKHYPQ